MPRRLPMFRAGAWVLALSLVVGILQVAWLAHLGVAVDRTDVRLGVVLPLVILAPSAALIFGWQIFGHAISLRDSMRKLAALDLEATRSEDEDLIGLRATFETMRAELDRALRKLTHDGAQRRRLFADLAHELATPASALLGLGDTLGRSDIHLDEARRAHLQRCLEGETLRVARLVEDIRDLAELDDPDVVVTGEPTDLAAIVARVVDRFGSQPGASLALESAPVTSAVDPERIDQVVTNLLTNARRYSPADRAIRIRVGPRPDDGDLAEIVVEDRGPGVADADLARLGERLFRVDPARDRRTGGHGLGLSIVRAIVERHGGTVEFARTPAAEGAGQGSAGGLRVTIRLPRTDEVPRSTG